MKDINFLTVLISLGSSIVTALVSYFLNSSKTKAETAKIKAETDKIIAETKNLSSRIDSALKSSNTEIIYYDCAKPTQFDFEVTKQKIYDDNLKKEIGEKSGGEFTIIDNILNIERTDGHGRFGLILKSYTKGNETFDCIKVDPTIGQQRKIYITCEIKSLKNKKHTLDFVLRNIDSFEWIANKKIIVESYEWTKHEAFFRVSPDKSFRLKLYDRDVQDPPNSIQIRNLKVVEKY
jgi:hypothetical protein